MSAVILSAYLENMESSRAWGGFLSSSRPKSAARFGRKQPSKKKREVRSAVILPADLKDEQLYRGEGNHSPPATKVSLRFWPVARIRKEDVKFVHIRDKTGAEAAGLKPMRYRKETDTYPNSRLVSGGPGE